MKSKNFIIIFLLSTITLLSGCSIMPGQGPSAMDIALMDSPEQEEGQVYVTLNLDSQSINLIENYVPKSFLSEFGSAQHSEGPIFLGIDDQLTVNIWEASADGLFSTIEKKQTEINTEVDENGDIFIPYVGRVSAINKTVEQVRQIIEQGLMGKAVEPQVQVLLSTNNSNNITMVGDITKPGQYPLPTRGMRLMEAVAQAGGTKQATFESEATIVRNSYSGTVWLDETIRNSKKNIWLTSKDIIQILHRPRSFSAFGAVGSKHLVPFTTETVNLAEALAQVGGLNDDLADSGGVFLFRFEEASLIKTLNFPNLTYVKGPVATIYRLDFNKPRAFFLASSFSMRDKDIIYVSNAPAAEFKKFFNNIVAPIIGTARPIYSTIK